MHLVKTFICVLITLLIACACGGGTDRQPQDTPTLSATVLVPAAEGGKDATWRVDIAGGTPPFLVMWDFGTGATPQLVTQEKVSALSELTVTMLNPLLSGVDSTISVEVWDATGLHTAVQSHYNIARGANPTRPVIRDTSYHPETGILDVVVSHWRTGEGIQVTADAISGVIVENPVESQVFAGEGTLRFKLQPRDLFNSSQGELSITAEDSLGYTDTWQQTLDIQPTYKLEPDTLYAIPLQRRAKVGEPVTIVVATGPIAEDKPFHFLNGIGLTIEDTAYYAHGTTDEGSPGSEYEDVESGGRTYKREIPDGIWEFMDPGFFMHWMEFVVGTDIGNGRQRIDFNITPIGGHDIIGVKGALFNIEINATQPGTYHLGFQEMSGVERTYYTNSETTIYTWGTLMADEMGNLNVEGWDNTFVVVE